MGIWQFHWFLVPFWVINNNSWFVVSKVSYLLSGDVHFLFIHKITIYRSFPCHPKKFLVIFKPYAQEKDTCVKSIFFLPRWLNFEKKKKNTKWNHLSHHKKSMWPQFYVPMVQNKQKCENTDSGRSDLVVILNEHVHIKL